MGNPTPTLQVGLQPNPPGEAWVPINTWNLYLVAETPISWFLSLAPDGVQFRFWKGDVRPNPPEPPPVVGEIAGWLIPNSFAITSGLLVIPDETPPRTLTLAQQQAQVIADAIQAEVLEEEAPPPPEGP